MDATDWPKAVAMLGMATVFLFTLTIFFPVPWVILAAWLEERSKTKRILAKARLAEAEAALLRAKGAPTDV